MRAFISIDAPTQVRNLIKTIQSEIDDAGILKGSYIEPEKLHITLGFLGTVSQEKLDLIHAILQDINCLSFMLTTGILQTDTQRSPHYLWLTFNSPELTLFAQHIRTALSCVIKFDKPFLAHMTLIRIKQVPDSHALNILLKKYAITTVCWPVDHFTLTLSHITHAGSKYTPYASYQLKTLADSKQTQI